MYLLANFTIHSSSCPSSQPHTPEVIIVIVVDNETFTCLSFHEMMLVFGNVLSLLFLVSPKVQPYKKNNQKDQPKSIRVEF